MNIPDEQRVEQLKQELQALSLQIVDDNGSKDGYKIIDKAIKTLSSIKDLSFKKKKPVIPSGLGDLDVPHEFLCPISGELMKDPVILASEKTYDRSYIHEWLEEVNSRCSQTRQVLSHAILTPNHLVSELIQQWCKDNGVNLPTHVKDLEEQITTASDKYRLLELLEKLSLSLPDQKQAAKEIRLLTKTKPQTRSIFAEFAGAISKLISPLLPFEILENDHELQENIVTVLLNVSIPSGNKQIIGEHLFVIPLLTKSLSRGNIAARSNAAAALFMLSDLESNKEKIGEASVFKPLIDLLREDEHPSAMKDAAAAIFTLCTLSANRKIAVNSGAIEAIFQRIRDGVLVDELLPILVMLAEHKSERRQLVDLGAVKCLLNFINNATRELTKENCILILYNICRSSGAAFKEVRKEEDARGTISKLADEGSPKAKMVATKFLEQFTKEAKPKSELLPPIPEE